MNRRLSIIWNVTRNCCWACKFCCVDAIYTGHELKFNDDSSYELTLSQKLGVIDKLKDQNVKIDFSGGEIFSNSENIELIAYASKVLGKKNIGVSTSGAFLTNADLDYLSTLVNDVEMTLDCKPFEFYKLRPTGYHEFAANALVYLSSKNITTGVQTVITTLNINEKTLRDLFNWIIDNGITEWSLLRFFPSGRGERFQEYMPTHSEYCGVVDLVKSITSNSDLKVNFQYLLPNHLDYSLNCRAVKRSIGILPNGDVISCFWALGKKAQLKDPKFKLGNIAKQSLIDILNSDNAKYWRSCNECVIFNQTELEQL